MDGKTANIEPARLGQAAVNILKEKNYTIACAESCTGGLLTSKLVDVAGVSSVFLESVVCYSNASKIGRLGVQPGTLERYGAVSHETAAEMAKGIAGFLNSSIGLSTTGIAGPSGGSIEKPVGLVYIGLFIEGKTLTRKLSLPGSRSEIRESAAINALYFLLEGLGHTGQY